jgi:HAMP domain-containing protein
LLRDSDAFRQVIEEAESYFERRGKRAQNTQEYDEVVRLLRGIRESLVEQRALKASTITDLVVGMWCGRNWDRLPEQLHRRRMELDGVLRDIGLARERPQVGSMNLRHNSLARAAHAYVVNGWMHAQWLTALIAGEMLSDLRSSLAKRVEALSKLALVLMIAGGALGWLWDRSLGLMLIVVGAGGLGATFRIFSSLTETERILDEVRSGLYSGDVLAQRLERLNRRFGCDVSSTLAAVLRVSAPSLVSEIGVDCHGPRSEQ